MKRILYIILIGISVQLQAQNPQQIIDSLLLRIDTMDAKGQVMANISIATNYQFLPQGFKEVTRYAKKALEISEEHDFLGGKQMSYYYLAMAEWYGNEDFEKAKEYFEKTRELLLQANNTAKISDIDNAIGSLEMMQGNYDEALIFLQKAYDGALALENYENVAIISTNLGIIYNNTNDTLNAIKINESALKYLAKTNSPQADITTVGVYTNLADLYRRTGQKEKQKEVLQKARIKVDSMQMFRLEARICLAEAKMMDDYDQKEELYEFVNQKLPLFERNVGYDKEIYTSLLYFKARGLAEKSKYGEVKKIIGVLKENLGKSNVLHEKNLLQSIYDLSEKIGDYKSAFIHLDKFKVLNDSLLNAEQKEKVLTLERKYQLEKKDREIEKNQIENLELKKRNSFLFSGILGLILLGLLLYLWQYRRRQKETAKINQIEQKMLSLQMNPHFIFNAISSIQNYLFDKGDSKKAIHHLSTFATLMRQMLENSRERFIPLEEELDFLQNYLRLQKLRFDDRFEYEINVADGIDVNSLSIPPLLTQPFIENAIDHGKIYLVEDGLLKINIFRKKGDLIIQIIDNGVGLQNSNNDENNKPLIIKKKSLSISITNERLQLLSKLMKKKFYLEILPNETGQGTTINLNVPSVQLT